MDWEDALSCLHIANYLHTFDLMKVERIRLRDTAGREIEVDRNGLFAQVLYNREWYNLGIGVSVKLD